jgi:hypothetical protein
VATAVLGEPRHDVLRSYRWRDDFLRRNEAHPGARRPTRCDQR